MPERGEAGSGIRRVRWTRTPDGVSLAFAGCDIAAGTESEVDEGTAERAVSAGLAEYVATGAAGAAPKRKAKE